VAGVELLQQRPALLHAPQHMQRRTSKWVATLLSLLVPGLGAAYNGQTSKALVHFALFASCWQMAAVTNAVSFFVLGALGVWLFAAVDSYRAAQLISAGLAPNDETDPIARRLYGHPLAWAIVLIALGSIFLLNTFFGVQFPVRQMLPVALVLLGAYMLFDFLRSRRDRDTFDATGAPPPSFIGNNSAPLDMTRFSTGELNSQLTGARRTDATSWPFDPRA
jgi:LiaI-LiaF-like transmembrane region